MIQANEKLMHGNYVIYHGEQDMYCKLDCQDILNIATGYMENDKIHSPIPLTPEILEKCGFTQHHDDCHNQVIYIKNIFHDLPFQWGVYPNELASGFIVSNAKPLRYLHQIQNLYFALTGEELNVQL